MAAMGAVTQHAPYQGLELLAENTVCWLPGAGQASQVCLPARTVSIIRLHDPSDFIPT